MKFKHGTISGYNAGCPCSKCGDARLLYDRKRRGLVARVRIAADGSILNIDAKGPMTSKQAEVVMALAKVGRRA